ncbi:hypothetical protein LR48_Vigan01g051000 [Vigna angularis]|uniref:Uncharacterized protein n=1 Tax=Phaseolus angularis TaxID=3914 RepID=A0A0L9TK93_PHAAN|nr:hypothetical protein LR48_Vigan01g051000 [Vigna angularis]
MAVVHIESSCESSGGNGGSSAGVDGGREDSLSSVSSTFLETHSPEGVAGTSENEDRIIYGIPIFLLQGGVEIEGSPFEPDGDSADVAVYDWAPYGPNLFVSSYAGRGALDWRVQRLHIVRDEEDAKLIRAGVAVPDGRPEGNERSPGAASSKCMGGHPVFLGDVPGGRGRSVHPPSSSIILRTDDYSSCPPDSGIFYYEFSIELEKISTLSHPFYLVNPSFHFCGDSHPNGHCQSPRHESLGKRYPVLPVLLLERFGTLAKVSTSFCPSNFMAARKGTAASSSVVRGRRPPVARRSASTGRTPVGTAHRAPLPPPAPLVSQAAGSPVRGVPLGVVTVASEAATASEVPLVRKRKDPPVEGRKDKGASSSRSASKKSKKGKEKVPSAPLPGGVFSPAFNMSDRTKFHMSSSQRALIEPLSEAELTNAMLEMSTRATSLAWYLKEFADRRGVEALRAKLHAERQNHALLQLAMEEMLLAHDEYDKRIEQLEADLREAKEEASGTSSLLARARDDKDRLTEECGQLKVALSCHQETESRLLGINRTLNDDLVKAKERVRELEESVVFEHEEGLNKALRQAGVEDPFVLGFDIEKDVFDGVLVDLNAPANEQETAPKEPSEQRPGKEAAEDADDGEDGESGLRSPTWTSLLRTAVVILKELAVHRPAKLTGADSVHQLGLCWPSWQERTPFTNLDFAGQVDRSGLRSPTWTSLLRTAVVILKELAVYRPAKLTGADSVHQLGLRSYGRTVRPSRQERTPFTDLGFAPSDGSGSPERTRRSPSGQVGRSGLRSLTWALLAKERTPFTNLGFAPTNAPSGQVGRSGLRSPTWASLLRTAVVLRKELAVHRPAKSAGADSVHQLGLCWPSWQERTPFTNLDFTPSDGSGYSEGTHRSPSGQVDRSGLRSPTWASLLRTHRPAKSAGADSVHQLGLRSFGRQWFSGKNSPFTVRPSRQERTPFTNLGFAGQVGRSGLRSPTWASLR